MKTERITRYYSGSFSLKKINENAVGKPRGISTHPSTTPMIVICPLRNGLWWDLEYGLSYDKDLGHLFIQVKVMETTAMMAILASCENHIFIYSAD